jgi:hypothetical protein
MIALYLDYLKRKIMKKIILVSIILTLCTPLAYAINAGADININMGEVATLKATEIPNDIEPSTDLQWDIMGDVYGNGEIFYFSPSVAGTYTIHLIATNGEEDSVVVNVQSDAPPPEDNASVTLSAGEDQTICLGDIATLTATSSSITNFTWKIIEDTYSNSNTFYFSPSAIGTYTIRLLGDDQEDNVVVTVEDCSEVPAPYDVVDTYTTFESDTSDNRGEKIYDYNTSLGVPVRLRRVSELVRRGGDAPEYNIRVSLYSKHGAGDEAQIVLAQSELILQRSHVKPLTFMNFSDGGYSIIWGDESAFFIRKFDADGNIVINNKSFTTVRHTGGIKISTHPVQKLNSENFVVGECDSLGRVYSQVFDANADLLNKVLVFEGIEYLHCDKSLLVEPLQSGGFVLHYGDNSATLDGQGNKI